MKFIILAIFACMAFAKLASAYPASSIAQVNFELGTPFVCPADLDGYFVDNQRCSDYHYCIRGADTGLLSCFGDLVFSPNSDGTFTCAETSPLC